MRIYFTRHGESQANILHEISNRGLRHPLTQKGRLQAEALAARLAELVSRYGPISYLYTSPTLRAIETSIIVANRLDLEFEVTDALREFDCGVAEGRSDEEAWKLWHWVVDEWLEYGHYDSRIEAGESFNDLRDRFVTFVRNLVNQYQGQNISVVCMGHGGLYYSMLPQVISNLTVEKISQLKIDYTTCIVAENQPEGLVCIEWNGESI
jgi:broad specificity phosphatase PhoE